MKILSFKHYIQVWWMHFYSYICKAYINQLFSSLPLGQQWFFTGSSILFTSSRMSNSVDCPFSTSIAALTFSLTCVIPRHYWAHKFSLTHTNNYMWKCKYIATKYLHPKEMGEKHAFHVDKLAHLSFPKSSSPLVKNETELLEVVLGMLNLDICMLMYHATTGQMIKNI